MPLTRKRRAQLGIAIGLDRIHAARVDRSGRGARQSEVWSRPLTVPADAAGDWSDLDDALAELRVRIEGRPFAAHVALLPPLAQVRSIDLPPLPEDESRRLLSRDAARYFFAVREPQVVAVRRTPGRWGRGRAGPVLGAAAAAHLVDALYGAVEAAGGRMVSILPAHTAWTVAAAGLWPDLSRGLGQLIVDSGKHLEVLRVVSGQLRFVRRLPSSCDAAQLAGAISLSDGGSAAVAVMAAEPARRHVADLLAGHGIDPLAPVNDVWPGEEPAAVAAVFAARGGTLRLLPERVYRRARGRARRATVALGLAAGLLLAMAGGLEWWGVQRELHDVRAQRAAIRVDVERVSAVRDVLNQVSTDLAMLVSLEADAPRWSRVVATVADQLPRDAHLSAFRARQDTVVLEGMARDASGVFEAMQRAAGVSAVRADAPIRRELRDGQPVVERFALRARLGAGSDPAEVLP